MAKLEGLVSGLVGGVLGGSLGDKWGDRKARRLQRQAQTECALRVLAGQHPGLSSTWARGTANLAPGVIDMGWAVVSVIAGDPSLVRSPTAKEAWSINPRMRLVRVETATAVLEWAVREKQVDWAAGVVLRLPGPAGADHRPR